MNNNEKTNERRKTLMSLVLPFLFGSLFTNFFLIKERNQLISNQEKAMLLADSSISVKLLVEKQYNETQESLNFSQIKNDELHTTVLKLNSELKERNKTIEKITRENNKTISLKKQLKDSRNLLDDYEKRLSNVIKDKADLENQIADLNKVISDIKRDNDELKKKLEWAKELKGYEISVMNYKVRNEKKKLTKRAKNVNRILVSFTLAENMVSETGNKNIHVVIYDPKNKVLSSTQEKFLNKKSNSEQLYSVLKVIEFKNEEKQLLLDYETPTKLTRGKYRIEIYADGNLCGKKGFELY